jgi:hypothetical protein
MPMRSFARSPGGTTCGPKNSAVSTRYGTYSTTQLRSKQSSLTFQPDDSLDHVTSGWPSGSRVISGRPHARVSTSRTLWPCTIATMPETVPASTRTVSFTSLTPESTISSSRTPWRFGSWSAGTSRFASAALMPGASWARPRGGSIVGPQKSLVAAGALLHAASAIAARARRMTCAC